MKSRRLDLDTQQPIDNVAVFIESNLEKGVITNQNGEFETYANANDVIV